MDRCTSDKRSALAGQNSKSCHAGCVACHTTLVIALADAAFIRTRPATSQQPKSSRSTQAKLGNFSQVTTGIFKISHTGHSSAQRYYPSGHCRERALTSCGEDGGPKRSYRLDLEIVRPRKSLMPPSRTWHWHLPLDREPMLTINAYRFLPGAFNCANVAPHLLIAYTPTSFSTLPIVTNNALLDLLKQIS